MGQDLDIGVHTNNLAYNIIVIEAFWKKIHGSLGDNCVTYQDENSLYWTLEKSKESLRNMKSGMTNITRDSHSKWASKVENKTGISRAFLMGIKRIRLGEEFDTIQDNMFDDYIEACQQIDEVNDGTTNRNMGFAKSNLEKYIKSASKSEREEIIAIVEAAKEAINSINRYKSRLKNEIDYLLKNGIGSITDKESYRAVYFLVNRKPASFAAMTTANDLIELLENIKAKQLSKLGEKNLLRMRAALEKDLELVNAVIAIGDEIKEFK